MAAGDTPGGDGGPQVGDGSRAASVRLVTAAMMLAMSVAALEQTVVATAMPRIVAALGGGEIYPWVFSAYLLTATVSTPIYGKLADLWGRKRLLLFGLGLFLLGSILSGLSRSMGELIAMRALQGLGAGAVMPLIITLLGDLYTLKERARVQGYFSAVWGAASVAGPILGGWLTDRLSWRWVFFITVPFGLAASLVIGAVFREEVREREVRPIDWPGAGMLGMGTTLLLLALLGGTGSSTLQAAGLAALALLIFGLFGLWERRAVDPILPLDLLATPAILAAVAGSFLVGGLLFGVDAYLPLYVQAVLGRRATDSGMLLVPLFLSWSLSVAVAAKVVVRYGFRASATAGTLLIVAGMAGIVLGTADARRTDIFFACGLVVMGLGMGPATLSYMLSVQNAVPWNRRGVATGSVTFSRTIGGVLGVAAFGAALAWELGRRMPGFRDVAAALKPETLHRLGPEALAGVRETLGHSLRDVFVLMLAAAALGFFCALYLPAGRARGPSRVGPAEREDRLPAAVFD